jgi:hypothetical protein
VGTLQNWPAPELIVMPQLWRADDIENLSVCRYCGSREQLRSGSTAGIPYRVCADCTGEPVFDKHEHKRHDQPHRKRDEP